MGLDAVEIVMDVEDHFGITIQNAEAEHVLTVGDLAALIQDRIIAAHISHCPTLPAFLKLRSTIRDITDDTSFRIRPRQRIVDALTVTQRRELWKRLIELFGSSPRGLRRPRILRQILGILVIVLLSVALIAAAAIDIRIAPATLGLAALTILCLHIITVRFRIVPPDELTTFGDVTIKLAGLRVATKKLTLRTLDDILLELRPLIVDTLGVDGDEVVLDARFVEDLGVG